MARYSRELEGWLSKGETKYASKVRLTINLGSDIRDFHDLHTHRKQHRLRGGRRKRMSVIITSGRSGKLRTLSVEDINGRIIKVYGRREA